MKMNKVVNNIINKYNKDNNINNNEISSDKIKLVY